jgi:hypothetical protein
MDVYSTCGLHMAAVNYTINFDMYRAHCNYNEVVDSDIEELNKRCIQLEKRCE